jgi:hypothetical protein
MVSGMAILLGTSLLDTAVKWLALELGVWTCLWLMLCIKKHNLSSAWFSLINWHVVTVAALLGASRALADPSVPISAREIT